MTGFKFKMHSFSQTIAFNTWSIAFRFKMAGLQIIHCNKNNFQWNHCIQAYISYCPCKRENKKNETNNTQLIFIAFQQASPLKHNATEMILSSLHWNIMRQKCYRNNKHNGYINKLQKWFFHNPFIQNKTYNFFHNPSYKIKHHDQFTTQKISN